MADRTSSRYGVVMLVSNPGGSIGGTERQAQLLAAELDRRGIPVIIVTQSRQPSVPPAAPSPARTVPIVRLPTIGWLPAWSFLASFLVWAATHRRRFDLIHAHNTSLGVVASIAGRLLGRPVIAKVTGMRHVERLANPARLRRLRRWVLTRNARLIALSADMRSALSRIGVHPERIDLIPNGVAPVPEISDDDRAALRAAWLGRRTDGVALFVGSLTEVKRVALLLDVWAKVAPGRHAVLLIVGDGGLRQSLEATAAGLGLGGSVRFVGRQADVTGFYLMADVFVLPSASEGMSNALLEAMAAGLPVVASDIAANQEIVQHGRSGFLVDWTDPAPCAALLSTLLADASLRRRVGHAARSRAALFSIDAVADRYCRLYRAMIGPEPRRLA